MVGETPPAVATVKSPDKSNVLEPDPEMFKLRFPVFIVALVGILILLVRVSKKA
jgi:hypothetical protein